MITIEDIMSRLNCSKQRAKLFFKWYGNDQEKIRRELVIQQYKQASMPAVINNTVEEYELEELELCRE